jgi:hypothetical protein
MDPIGTKYLQCATRSHVKNLTISSYHSKKKWPQLGPIGRLHIKQSSRYSITSIIATLN